MTTLKKEQIDELEIKLTKEQEEEFSNGRGDMPSQPPIKEGDE